MFDIKRCCIHPPPLISVPKFSAEVHSTFVLFYNKLQS
jgi:hypothetical protein